MSAGINTRECVCVCVFAEITIRNTQKVRKWRMCCSGMFVIGSTLSFYPTVCLLAPARINRHIHLLGTDSVCPSSNMHGFEWRMQLLDYILHAIHMLWFAIERE